MQVQRDLVIHFYFVVSNARECSSEVDSSKSFFIHNVKVNSYSLHSSAPLFVESA